MEHGSFHGHGNDTKQLKSSHALCCASPAPRNFLSAVLLSGDASVVCVRVVTSPSTVHCGYECLSATASSRAARHLSDSYLFESLIYVCVMRLCGSCRVSCTKGKQDLCSLIVIAIRDVLCAYFWGWWIVMLCWCRREFATMTFNICLLCSSLIWMAVCFQPARVIRLRVHSDSVLLPVPIVFVRQGTQIYVYWDEWDNNRLNR